LEMPHNLMPKTRLYRNFDKRFEDFLQRESAQRYIPVDITMEQTLDGFHIIMTDDYGLYRTLDVTFDKQLARTPQHENIRLQFSRMGDTNFRLRNLNINYTNNWFIPSSLLGAWRRELTKVEPTHPTHLSHLSHESHESHEPHSPHESHLSHEPHSPHSYLLNVMNLNAKRFYEEQGVEVVESAYEQSHPKGVPVMFCKHCIRYSLGWCPKHSKSSPNSGGAREGLLFLQMANGTRFRLDFDCKECMMKVIKDE